MKNKYTSIWYRIFFVCDDIPFECYAAEKVAKDETDKMNWAIDAKKYMVKPVHITLKYED